MVEIFWYLYVYSIYPALEFLKTLGLAAFPYLMASGFAALFIVGSIKIYNGWWQGKRVALLGVSLVCGSMLLGAISHAWWYGPRIGRATLHPLLKDQEFASKLPRTVVFPYGAAFEAINILPKKYADHVLNEHILTTELLDAVPAGQRDLFMEEVQLVDTDSCHDSVRSADRILDVAIRCTKAFLVKKDIIGPYLTLHWSSSNEEQSLMFSVVADGAAIPIAKCVLNARKETNSFLAALRRDWHRDAISSLLECRKRAMAGDLQQVISTGEAI